jgi:hypothetical protein
MMNYDMRIRKRSGPSPLYSDSYGGTEENAKDFGHDKMYRLKFEPGTSGSVIA